MRIMDKLDFLFCEILIAFGLDNNSIDGTKTSIVQRLIWIWLTDLKLTKGDLVTTGMIW